ncbi:hypothetical protein [Streptacidiphilus melanogenes]|uniref:hypothetical protein n=1 Tax=Streptacidiphilus melanogenes TaxID=411235 RepID=UPI0005AA4C0A|nr:hypothetical protein [Streptacidiphilus melanogenes]
MRSGNTGADILVEKLAQLIFEGERDWPARSDRFDAYRDRLTERFVDDSARERQFVELTGPDADPGVFIDWFLPVVLAWEEDGSAESGQPAWDEARAVFYRTGPGGAFEFAEAKTRGQQGTGCSGSWLSHQELIELGEDPATRAHGWDGARAMFHRTGSGGAFEFAEAKTRGQQGTGCSGSWLSHQELIELGEDPATRAHGWDGARAMFYRTGPGGAFEFAEANTRGQRTSGCTATWLTDEQARERALAADEVTETQDGPIDPLTTSQSVYDKVMGAIAGEGPASGTTEQERTELWNVAWAKVHEAAADCGPDQQEQVAEAAVQACLEHVEQETQVRDQLVTELQAFAELLAGDTPAEN